MVSVSRQTRFPSASKLATVQREVGERRIGERFASTAESLSFRSMKRVFDVVIEKDSAGYLVATVARKGSMIKSQIT